MRTRVSSPAVLPLVLALIGCTDAPAPRPAGPAAPTEAPVPVPQSPPVPEPTDEVLLVDAGWRGQHYAALVRLQDGVWRRTCDRVDGLQDPHHGDVLIGRLSRRTERDPEHDYEVAVCTVEVRERTTLAARGHTLYAPPALGPFTAGMSTLEVAKIAGVPEVPDDTDPKTHVRFGPFEVQMKRGMLYFVSARRSELGAMVVEDLPLVPAGAEIALQATLPPDSGYRGEVIGQADNFKPSLPDALARSYAKLTWSSDGDGGWSDLRPLAEEVLLFAAMGRSPEKRAHLRSALISLHLRGLL